MSINEVVTEDLDVEWVELILKARDLGITPDEIRVLFIQNQTEKKTG